MKKTTKKISIPAFQKACDSCDVSFQRFRGGHSINMRYGRGSGKAYSYCFTYDRYDKVTGDEESISTSKSVKTLKELEKAYNNFVDMIDGVIKND